jgi:hypothetical protein
MRAVWLREFGGPEVLVADESPEPMAGPGQALIDVAYANITFVETQVRAGRPPNPAMAPEPPVILGDGGGAVARSAFELLERRGRMLSYGQASGEWANITDEEAAARGVLLVHPPPPTPPEMRALTSVPSLSRRRVGCARSLGNASPWSGPPMRTRRWRHGQPWGRPCWKYGESSRSSESFTTKAPRRQDSSDLAPWS